MKRGELYRVTTIGGDPKKFRVFVIVSRQILIDSKFSSVICAPVYSVHDGLATQVEVGTELGLKHESSIHCDELVSIPKAKLNHYMGSLDRTKLESLTDALKIALDL